MAFDGTEGKKITLAEGATLTANYRHTITTGTVIGHFFGKDILQSILAQSGCVGIRMYHAIDENGIKNLVLVGVDSSQNDLVSGIVADRSVICPPMGCTLNALNS